MINVIITPTDTLIAISPLVSCFKSITSTEKSKIQSTIPSERILPCTVNTLYKKLSGRALGSTAFIGRPETNTSLKFPLLKVPESLFNYQRFGAQYPNVINAHAQTYFLGFFNPIEI